jgi:hypothetical protein
MPLNSLQRYKKKVWENIPQYLLTSPHYQKILNVESFLNPWGEHEKVLIEICGAQS